MRAGLFTGAGVPITVADVEPLPPGPRDAVVRVAASGVCHSDLSVLTGARPIPAPAIIGHEGAGWVEEVGPDVSRVAPGDHVVASFIPTCGNCGWCRRDESHLCEAAMAYLKTPRARYGDRQTIAHLGLGTFAERMVVHETSLVRVQTDLPDEQLALLGCGVTTGVCAVLNTARVQAGCTVAVIGCGGVGQAVIQGARIAGATQIIAIDPVAFKRETAERFGATHVVDPSADEPIPAVHALTDGVGVDYAFEAIGLETTMADAFAMTRRGGTTIVVGMPHADAKLTLPAFSLFAEGKHVIGSKYGSAQVRRDIQRLIDLTEAGRLDLASMITRRYPLDQVGDAFHAMQNGTTIRSVLT